MYNPKWLPILQYVSIFKNHVHLLIANLSIDIIDSQYIFPMLPEWLSCLIWVHSFISVLGLIFLFVYIFAYLYTLGKTDHTWQTSTERFMLMGKYFISTYFISYTQLLHKHCTCASSNKLKASSNTHHKQLYTLWQLH